LNLSAPFIRRPVATTLLAIGVALAGILSFNLLPIASLPQVEFPVILVQASLPGASPENMSSSVVMPLESSLSRISGISDMTSSTTPGSARIIIQFDINRNIDGAARDVQAAINAASAKLPDNMKSLPTYRKVNPADAPIIVFALTSETRSPAQMYDIASTILQQKLLKIEGVGQLMLAGSALPAIRIELNPTKMNKYGIALDDVSKIISSTNINSPKGQILDQDYVYEIIANDQLFLATEYNDPLKWYQK